MYDAMPQARSLAQTDMLGQGHIGLETDIEGLHPHALIEGPIRLLRLQDLARDPLVEMNPDSLGERENIAC